MIDYIFIILSALGCAVNFALTKVYQLEEGTSVRSSILFSCLVGVPALIISFVLTGGRLEFTTFSVIMAILMVLFSGSYTLLGFKIMSLGSLTVYTLFLMMGGMIVPYFYGLIFLSEQISVMKFIAFVIIIAAMILQKQKSDKKGSGLFYLLCVVIFFLNGGCSVVSKTHQIVTAYPTVQAQNFVLIQNIFRVIFFTIVLQFCKKEESKKTSKKSYMVIVLSALVSNIASVLLLVSASNVPATVLYPVQSGGTIAFTGILDMLCFKSHLSRKQTASIIMCIAATVLFSM